MSSIDQLRELWRKYTKATDEVLAEINAILGDTPEEREATRTAFEGLTPPELRVAVTQYRERRALLRHLKEATD